MRIEEHTTVDQQIVTAKNHAESVLFAAADHIVSNRGPVDGDGRTFDEYRDNDELTQLVSDERVIAGEAEILGVDHEGDVHFIRRHEVYRTRLWQMGLIKFFERIDVRMLTPAKYAEGVIGCSSDPLVELWLEGEDEQPRWRWINLEVVAESQVLQRHLDVEQELVEQAVSLVPQMFANEPSRAVSFICHYLGGETGAQRCRLPRKCPTGPSPETLHPAIKQVLPDIGEWVADRPGISNEELGIQVLCQVGEYEPEAVVPALEPLTDSGLWPSRYDTWGNNGYATWPLFGLIKELVDEEFDPF